MNPLMSLNNSIGAEIKNRNYCSGDQFKTQKDHSKSNRVTESLETVGEFPRKKKKLYGRGLDHWQRSSFQVKRKLKKKPMVYSGLFSQSFSYEL